MPIPDLDIEDQRWILPLRNRMQDPAAPEDERRRIQDYLSAFAADKLYQAFVQRFQDDKTAVKKPKEIDLHHPFGQVFKRSRPILDINWKIAVDDAFRRIQSGK